MKAPHESQTDSEAITLTPQHFIHYLPRRIVTRYPQHLDSPWFADVQSLNAGFSRPMFHTSRRKSGPTSKVKPGDTIWLVSQIFSPWGMLPPALDARFDVDKIEKRENGTHRFVAAKTSSWFPLADASALVATLKTRNAEGMIRKLQTNPNLPIGQYLQSMRLLASADLLQAWSQKLTPSSSNFISYRICDGTLSAYLTIKELLAAGEAIFWDRWCLPRRLAERRELVDDEALNAYLMDQLRQSKVVWGIESKKYSAINSYSAKEKIEAIRLGKYQPVAVKSTTTNRSEQNAV
jgi:hypothetical protein